MRDFIHCKTAFCCKGTLLDSIAVCTSINVGEGPIFSHMVERISQMIGPNFLSWIWVWAFQTWWTYFGQDGRNDQLTASWTDRAVLWHFLNAFQTTFEDVDVWSFELICKTHCIDNKCLAVDGNGRRIARDKVCDQFKRLYLLLPFGACIDGFDKLASIRHRRNDLQFKSGGEDTTMSMLVSLVKAIGRSRTGFIVIRRFGSFSSYDDRSASITLPVGFSSSDDLFLEANPDEDDDGDFSAWIPIREANLAGGPRLGRSDEKSNSIEKEEWTMKAQTVSF